MCIIERIAVHNLDLHALRVAVSLYHELAVHDRDLHSLRSAVLLYHKSAIYDLDLHALRAAVLLYHESEIGFKFFIRLSFVFSMRLHRRKAGIPLQLPEGHLEVQNSGHWYLRNFPRSCSLRNLKCYPLRCLASEYGWRYLNCPAWNFPVCQVARYLSGSLGLRYLPPSRL